MNTNGQGFCARASAIWSFAYQVAFGYPFQHSIYILIGGGWLSLAYARLQQNEAELELCIALSKGIAEYSDSQL
jgi:hypothetical protein